MYFHHSSASSIFCGLSSQASAWQNTRPYKRKGINQQFASCAFIRATLEEYVEKLCQLLHCGLEWNHNNLNDIFHAGLNKSVLLGMPDPFFPGIHWLCPNAERLFIYCGNIRWGILQSCSRVLSHHGRHTIVSSCHNQHTSSFPWGFLREWRLCVLGSNSCGDWFSTDLLDHWTSPGMNETDC